MLYSLHYLPPILKENQANSFKVYGLRACLKLYNVFLHCMINYIQALVLYSVLIHSFLTFSTLVAYHC